MVPAYTPRHPKVREYIATVDKTLDEVFHLPEERRKRIVASLRREQDRDYWRLTFHDLPLYSAAQLAGVQIVYPDFDKYEVLYAELIEGKGSGQVAQTGDD